MPQGSALRQHGWLPAGVVETPSLRAVALDDGSRISFADYMRESFLGASLLLPQGSALRQHGWLPAGVVEVRFFGLRPVKRGCIAPRFYAPITSRCQGVALCATPVRGPQSRTGMQAFVRMPVGQGLVVGAYNGLWPCAQILLCKINQYAGPARPQAASDA